MKCRWCKGTYEECGCGEGYCDHCNNGETTDPPYGPLVLMDKTKFCRTIPDQFFVDICDFYKRTCHEQIEYVSHYVFNEQLLTDEEIANFKAYWDDPYRDECIGEVLVRIVYYIRTTKLNETIEL